MNGAGPTNLFEWTRDYEAAVAAGRMTMAESVTRFDGWPIAV
jgi:hypothetical protein